MYGMLDINFIKKNTEVVREVIKNKGVKGVDIDELLGVYDEYLEVLKNVENQRNLRNDVSSKISKSSGSERDTLMSKASEIKQDLSVLEPKLVELKNKVDSMLPYVPNIVSEEMPVGVDEHENLILKVWNPASGYLNMSAPGKYDDISYAPELKFKPKDHIELGERLDIIDINQSAKVSGSRFYYLKGEAAILLEAVFSLLKSELNKRGYTPLIPPIMVKERSLFGTSHFPEGRDQVYKVSNDNVEDGNELFLIGSAEPANFSYFMDKVLEKEDLPIKVYAQTSCFRSEVGSWGKDVRGIKRVHQFDKLEMNCVCTEDQERKVFDEFLEINEWLFQQLEIPYRVVNKCTGDCGYNASYFQYDIEGWRPGEKEYMELGTNTMTTDYQARRLNIRYRDSDGLKYARTVNDTGASTRPLIVLLENHQQEDGSVNIPEALHPYTGFKKILPKA